MSREEEQLTWSTPSRGAEGRYGSSDEETEQNRAFSGFASRETTIYKRMLMLERKLDKWIGMIKNREMEESQNWEFHRDLKARVRGLEEREKQLIKENEELKGKVAEYEKSMKDGLGEVIKENESLKKLVTQEEKRVREEVLGEMKTWKVESEKANVNLREVIQQQMKEDKEDVEKEVVKVIKKNEELVREVADKKKSVIVFGLKEKTITYKPKRDKEELKSIKDLLKNLNDDEQQSIEEEVEEIHRMGPYTEGKTRPIKIKLRSQKAAEDILYRTTKLKETEDCKDIYI